MRGRHALFLTLGGIAAFSPARADGPPNVVFILVDDLGYGDLGCFGQKEIQTPRIDRLAAEGTRFRQAYAGAAVCAPSRCSLMTGLHNGHASVRGNREVKPEGQQPMPASTFTVAHLMKRAGHATGLIGKWGLGHPGSTSTPDKMGFDEFFGYNCQRKAHEYYPDSLWRDDQRVPLDGKTYSHDLMVREALDFVRRHRDRPFFLDLSLTIPHAKLQVPGLGIYADKPWTNDEKTLAAMISRMDADVGRLVDLIDELGLKSKTLVVFASDNGAAWSFPRFRDSGALRGKKRDLYEGGVRTPAIVRWPGRTPAGAVSDAVWAFWDVLPTLAELTGQQPPAGLDGVSVVAAWTGGKAAAPHPPLYYEFHERGFDQAARIGDWKAVRNGFGTPLELYDLAADPAERHDVASTRPELVREFDAYLKSARTDSPEWPIRQTAAQTRAARKKAAP